MLVSIKNKLHHDKLNGDFFLFYFNITVAGHYCMCWVGEGFDSKNPRVFLSKKFEMKKKYGQVVDSKNGSVMSRFGLISNQKNYIDKDINLIRI